ncbi:MAG: hypothetical protein AAF081_03160 [Actinomycetota bacterium]
MQSRLRRIVAVMATAMTLATIVVVPAGAAPTPGLCSSPGEIDYLFDFDVTDTVSGVAPSDAYTVPLSSAVPSGIEYSIFVHVYDGYDGRVGDGDAVEQLVVDFLDANGAVVTSTAANVDLNNIADEAEDFGLRGVGFFAREAVSVRVRHVLDGSGADPATGLGLVCVSLRIKQIFPDLTTTTTTTTTSTTTTVPDTTTTTSTTTTVPDTTTSTSTTTTTVPDTTTTTSTTTTVPDTTTSTSTTTTTVPDTTTTTSTTTTTVPDTTTTTTTVPDTTTTAPDTTTTTAPTTTTTVAVGGPTTSTTVPTEVLPDVETSDPADPVDATPTFTG